MNDAIRKYHLRLILVSAAYLVGTQLFAKTNDPARFVDPFIGTSPSTAANPVPGGRGGSVFPGAALPFGMVQFSPDTPKGEPSGYSYDDREISGFSLTHFSGAGCANNDELPLLPTVGDGNEGRPIGFAHADEGAAPGYYYVTLANGVKVELSATLRSGMGRFTYPANDEAKNLLFDTKKSATGTYESGITINSPQEISGFAASGNFCNNGTRYNLYFVAEFDTPFTIATLSATTALLNFGSGPGTVVQSKIGLSYVSMVNARENLRAENPTFDFAAVKDAARAQWNSRLSHVDVTGGSTEETTTFYTALYHSLLHPNVASDVNGDTMGFDKLVRKAEGYTHYVNFSGWDIYRSQVQLLAFLFPDVASDMAQSLLVDADQCGAMPKWSHQNSDTGVMVGDPASAIVASVHAFGGVKFDVQKALHYMAINGNAPKASCNGFFTRLGLKGYIGLGYIPEGTANVWGGVSTGLEYAAADFAIAQLALAAGDEAMYRVFSARAMTWRNLFDSESGLLRPRNLNGSWWTYRPFGPATTDGFVEGNAGQYVWMVPHDPNALIARMGGAQIAGARLDQLFTKLNAGISDPFFYMGNEPNFASPWLYPWTDTPWRTQDVVRRIMDEAFSAKSGGLPGNDDLGATSSWYVWSALGLYPLVPGVGGFVLSTPRFPHTQITMENNQMVELIGQGAPSRYVTSLQLDGQAYDRAWIDADRLRAGASLAYVLGDTPSTWGTRVKPPKFTKDIFTNFDEALNAQSACSESGDTGPMRANFDGEGACFSSQSMAAAGLYSGATVHHRGVTFHWPEAKHGVDHVISLGQTINFGSGTKGQRLAFLGATNDGPGEGEGLVIYTDGSEQIFKLGFSDWTLNGGKAKPNYGNEIALTLPYRLSHEQRIEYVKTHVFFSAVPLDATKVVAQVRLPSIVSRGQMHIFAVEVTGSGR